MDSKCPVLPVADISHVYTLGTDKGNRLIKMTQVTAGAVENNSRESLCSSFTNASCGLRHDSWLFLALSFLIYKTKVVRLPSSWVGEFGQLGAVTSGQNWYGCLSPSSHLSSFILPSFFPSFFPHIVCLWWPQNSQLLPWWPSPSSYEQRIITTALVILIRINTGAFAVNMLWGLTRAKPFS